MHQKLKLRDLASGQTLRNYRHRLAGFTQAKDSILTSKFKLELPQGCTFAGTGQAFDVFKTTYEVIEGCQKGSLTYFLFAVVLSGFRVLATAPEAAGFAARHAYDEQGFQKAVIQAVGVPLKDFTVEKILKRLNTLPRTGKDGKKKDFVEGDIASEYRKSLCGTLPKGARADVVERIFARIAQELAQNFKAWIELKNNLADACECVDRALESVGEFPSLRGMVEQETVSLPKNSTIVFDRKVPFFELTPQTAAWAPYAAVSTILGYEEKDPKTDPGKFVTDHLVTVNSNGLSWLFNLGLKLFQNNNAAELCRLFDVPLEEIARVEQVREAALAIPEQALFFKNERPFGYHEFRTTFGGHISSWTSNYINRLKELKTLVDLLGDTLPLPEFRMDGKDFLETTDCKRSEIEVLCKAYAEQKPRIETALKNLLGADAGAVGDDVACVVDFSALVNRLYSVREQIKNALEQAKKYDDSEWQGLGEQIQKDFALWDKLDRLPKLNKMTGGVPDIEAEIAQTLETFERVRAGQLEHFNALMDWVRAEALTVDVPASVAQDEKEKAGKRFADKIDADELALRRILQRLARVVQDRFDACAADVKQWFKTQGIFAQEKDANKFFCNREGHLYVSPFSTGRHQAYAMGADVLRNGKRVWESFVAFAKEKEQAYPAYSEAAETLLRLQGLVIGMTVAALPRAVPSDLAALHLTEAVQAESVPEGLRLQMSQGQVTPAVLSKVFNTYSSLMSGALIVLRRTRFFLRTKFIWVGNTSLVYVPKTNTWKMPKARYEGSALWKEIFDSGLIVWANDNEVDVPATFERVAEAWRPEKAWMRELLHQLPHDWCYELSAKQDRKAIRREDLVCGLCLSKDGSKGTKIAPQTFNRKTLARLIGPSAFKERLNALLLHKDSTVGDMNLLADQEYNQKVLADGAIFTRGKLELSLAIPMKTPVVGADESVPAPFKRVLSVDQGEIGFAYAVFDLGEAGNAKALPIATGTVYVPSLRRLIKQVRGFRKHKQSAQKFNQRFDSTMFSLRENAAGDVCGAIAGLMSRYRALPVLERQVSNLESGGKQLELVYKMVNARFIADMILAHQTERASWWYGASTWGVPNLWEEVSEGYAKDNKGKKDIRELNGKFYRPLQVAPGSAVNAKWTSRICSHCGNNISELIAKAKEDKVKNVSLDQNGDVRLYGKWIRLYNRPSADVAKQARRRNERAAWTVPLANRTLDLNTFAKYAKDNLRRAPKSLQTKDTSQSQYFCVFKDCEYHNIEQHADVNAAINIGRRFLGELVKEEDFKVIRENKK